MKINNALLLFIALMFAGTINAQTATIKGKVETSDNQFAPFAKVVLVGTGNGAIANELGNYIIENVEPGTYEINASQIEGENQLVTVTVEAGQVLVQDFKLTQTVKEYKEVVVLAQRSNYKTNDVSSSLRMKTPIIEAPQNIQIITNEVLNDQVAFDMLESVQRNVSGAQRVEHWDNYARINMRGSQITPFRNGMNVKISPWSPMAEDMSMVERIEFVKGPAGFMLANGEPGGFYNVVTKKPTGLTKGEFGMTLGSFNTYRTTLDLDGKLTKNGKLLYRMNVMGQLKNSHREFEFNDRYSFAPVVKYVINDNSSITLEYNHQFAQTSTIGGNYAFSANGLGDLPLEFSTLEPNLDPVEMTDQSVFATFEHKINSQWSLTAQTSFVHYKQVGQSLWPWGVDSLGNMQRGISIWDALGTSKNGQIYVNGEVYTGKIKHRVLAGIDMSDRDYYADWNQGAALGDTFNIYDPQYGTIAAAEIPTWDRSLDIRERGVNYKSGYTGVYVQDELGFFENKLRVTLAGRFTTNSNVNPYSGTTNDSKFTPRAGLSWTFLPKSTTYVVYDQVFIGNPGLDWQGDSFDPLTGENLEWGIKRDWMNGKWNTGLSVYQITKNNVLTTDFEHADPITGQFIYQTQTGQQQVRGFEFDLKGQLAKGLQLIVNYAYTDAKVTKDSDPTIVGNRVAGSSTHIQNTWLNYRFSGNVLEGLSLSLGYQFLGDRSTWSVFEQGEDGLPNYMRMDAGIGYQVGRMRVNLLVNNLLDEYLYSGSLNFGNPYWQTEPGRNFRLNLTYRF